MTTCRETKQHPLVATAVLDAVALLPAEEPAGGASVGGGLTAVGPAAMALGPAAVEGRAVGMLSAPVGGGATSARAAARAVAMQGVVWLATALDRAWALPPTGSADCICKKLIGTGLVSGTVWPGYLERQTGVMRQSSIAPPACHLKEVTYKDPCPSQDDPVWAILLLGNSGLRLNLMGGSHHPKSKQALTI